MPIRNQIEAIVKSMQVNMPPVGDQTVGDPVTPGFLYGTSNELNRLADDADFPVVFMYAIQPIDLDTYVNGSVGSSISILLAFVFKTEYDQYTADDEVLVNTAHQWAQIFMIKASHYRVGEQKYFKVKAGTKGKVTPFYNKGDLDVCASGVTLAITLSVMYDPNLSAHYNNSILPVPNGE